MEEPSTRAKTDRGGPVGVSVKDLSQHRCFYPLLWGERREPGRVGTRSQEWRGLEGKTGVFWAVFVVTLEGKTVRRVARKKIAGKARLKKYGALRLEMAPRGIGL